MTEIDRRSAAMQQQQYNGQRGVNNNGLATSPQGSPFARQVRWTQTLEPLLMIDEVLFSNFVCTGWSN